MTSCNSLSSCAEEYISKCFYRKNSFARRQKAFAYGLQSPLWLWGVSGGGTSCLEKQKQKIANLVRWLVHSKRGDISVAVVTHAELFSSLQKEIDLIVLARNEFENQTTTASSSSSIQVDVILSSNLLKPGAKRTTTESYDIVVYVMSPIISLSAAVDQALSQGEEDWICEAIRQTKCSFILSADLSWISSYVCSRWPQMKHLVEKFQSEPLPISVEGQSAEERLKDEDRLPRLIGKAIPLCCSAHPNQRFLDYGQHPIEPKCQRFCGFPFSCGKKRHLCIDKCHSPALHVSKCPFRCDALLTECGHPCLLSCSEPCDCFSIVEKKLMCSHDIAIGVDKESGEIIYSSVEHHFRGRCTKKEASCYVEVPTVCARCWGPMKIPCCEAQEMNHTLQNKTIVCERCLRTAKLLRAEILGQTLCETEQCRKKFRTEVARAVHHQTKAAQQGVFMPGESVEIVDSTRCVAPVFEDDFPNIKFVSMDDPHFFVKMNGAYGTFISSHVDSIDIEEVRNLVRLPSGLHVLVTDGGLRLIHPRTSHVTSQQTLLLTYFGEEGEKVNEENESSKNLIKKAQSMVQQLAYFSSSVRINVDETEVEFSDSVGRVLRVDDNKPGNVVVEVVRYSSSSHHLTPPLFEDAKSLVGKAEGEITPLKPRIHVEPLSESVLLKITYSFSVSVSMLESLKGYDCGKKIYVSRPDHQIRDTVVLNMIAESAESVLGGGAFSFSASRLQENEAYEMVGLLNSPRINESYREIGPVVLLRKSVRSQMNQSSRVSRHRHCFSSVSSSNIDTAESSQDYLFAIPLMFTRPDEDAEAEEILDSAAKEMLQKRLEEAIEKQAEEDCYRNEEQEYYKLLQLPTVTEAARREARTAYSIPDTIPTESEIAALKQRHSSLCSEESPKIRLFELNELREKRREEFECFSGKWVASVMERIEQDWEGDKVFIKSLERNHLKA